MIAPTCARAKHGATIRRLIKESEQQVEDLRYRGLKGRLTRKRLARYAKLEIKVAKDAAAFCDVRAQHGDELQTSAEVVDFVAACRVCRRFGFSVDDKGDIIVNCATEDDLDELFAALCDLERKNKAAIVYC